MIKQLFKNKSRPEHGELATITAFGFIQSKATRLPPSLNFRPCHFHVIFVNVSKFTI